MSAPHTHSNLENEVRTRFGFSGFRPGQRELVEALLQGRDALGVMPTGGGKSLCFQLPATLLPGTALIISPLIALMKDQVDSLRAKGISAEAFHSGLSFEERTAALQRIRSGRSRIIYMAPERIQAEGFMDLLCALSISFLAIDEAHCISHWGHDFRPEYRRLHSLRDRLSGPHKIVPVIALTATATGRVQEDIVERLQMNNPVRMITGFRRPNLAFEVRKVSGRAEKFRRLRELCTEALERSGSAVIYAATRKSVELVATELATPSRDLGNFENLVGFYHAGLSDEQRVEVQDAFLAGKKRILVATNAFGMGIDKANVRVVAHYEIPGSIEAYYQEAGRAGRDGLPGRCSLLFNYADVATQEFFINKAEERQEDTESPESGAAADPKALLKQLVRYAYGAQCRQKIMLGYFGDPEAARFEGCGRCDVCAPVAVERAPVDERVTLASRQALAAVARLSGRFGKTRFAELLKGSEAATFLQSGLQSQTTYGLLKEWSLDSIRRLLDRLLEAGYLNSSGLDYPVLVISAEGLKAMRGETRVELAATFDEPDKPTSRKSKKQRAPSQERGKKEGPTGPIDSTLLENLREFRKQEARKRSVPSYVVFHDSTLQELAARKPKSASALATVPGLGPKKIELYGAKLIEILAAT